MLASRMALFFIPLISSSFEIPLFVFVDAFDFDFRSLSLLNRLTSLVVSLGSSYICAAAIMAFSCGVNVVSYPSSVFLLFCWLFCTDRFRRVLGITIMNSSSPQSKARIICFSDAANKFINMGGILLLDDDDEVEEEEEEDNTFSTTTIAILGVLL